MSFENYDVTRPRTSMEQWDQLEEPEVISASRYSRFSEVTSSVSPGVNASVYPVIPTGNGSLLEGLIVPLYAVIFFLSVIGNALVLITLARNKRMRTVTNVYLLNLAVSDLLLGVFCMPFTLLGQMLKNFVFGTTMCKLIPYFQAVSVSVGVWTLVAISLERYFAICRPLKSRRWQTQFHAYKMIAIIWAASLTWNAPILVVSTLKSIRGGRHKCREEWPNVGMERAYNLFLDATLLLIPLIVMIMAYSLIASKLWRGLRREIRHSSSCRRKGKSEATKQDNEIRPALLTRTGSSPTVNSCDRSNEYICAPSRHRGSLRCPEGYSQGGSRGNAIREYRRDASRQREPKNSGRASLPRTETVKLWLMRGMVRLPRAEVSRVSSGRRGSSSQRFRSLDSENGARERIIPEDGNEVEWEDQREVGCAFNRHAVRSTYMDRSIEAKKKVIRMLFVVVLEFFVCWAPLHVINTWYLFAPELVYSLVGSTGISLVHLLAYVSSCCNPITYCFMNRKFRQAFIGVFDCSNRCCRSVRTACGNELVAVGKTRIAHQMGNSEVSGNDSTVYLGRASLVARSEVVLLEAEDRV
ncbi:cholecystokinin receptor type A [Orussus abietinus]|uniref:cholecystokinin receptor type A n=1 Tax=Orussus abietinus TaxID=222816 RepID=UPI000C7160A5|nr:cholecystokinin receptor type A [Orussus abietinus]